ncbi:MAG: IS200/IS605 family transposase [Chitinophagaceae bacterium]|nr:IS200/IS605 family transposase [Chitinophagaceae bacterium]
MIHTQPCIWVHAVWSTRERRPFIEPAVEKAIYQYLASQLEEAGCMVRIVNGMEDHVHCLFRQNPMLSVSDTIKRVKSTSSNWINHQRMLPEKFGWQKGYAVYSVGSSGLEWIQHYIMEQKVHHRHKTYREEMAHFMRMHGMDDEVLV